MISYHTFMAILQAGLVVFITDNLLERVKQAVSLRTFDRAKSSGLGDRMYR